MNTTPFAMQGCVPYLCDDPLITDSNVRLDYNTGHSFTTYSHVVTHANRWRL